MPSDGNRYQHWRPPRVLLLWKCPNSLFIDLPPLQGPWLKEDRNLRPNTTDQSKAQCESDSAAAYSLFWLCTGFPSQPCVSNLLCPRQCFFSLLCVIQPRVWFLEYCVPVLQLCVHLARRLLGFGAARLLFFWCDGYCACFCFVDNSFCGALRWYYCKYSPERCLNRDLITIRLSPLVWDEPFIQRGGYRDSLKPTFRNCSQDMLIGPAFRFLLLYFSCLDAPNVGMIKYFYNTRISFIQLDSPVTRLSSSSKRQSVHTSTSWLFSFLDRNFDYDRLIRYVTKIRISRGYTLFHNNGAPTFSK